MSDTDRRVDAGNRTSDSEVRAKAPRDNDERLGIQSAEVAATILRALAEGGGQLPLRGLAAATGMHRGKVHRYLISLAREGLVTQDSRNGHYSIGPLAITIGLVGLRRQNPLRLAYEALPTLRDQTNETALLAVWGEMGATVIALEESSRSVTLNVRVGSVLPLHTTATGRAFAAFLPANVTAPELEKERAQLRTKKAPGPAAYQRILNAVRKRGMASIEGTLIPGISAMAAPVFDYRGKLSSVVGLVGHQGLMETAVGGKPAEALLEVAEALSRQLGYSKPILPRPSRVSG